MHGSVNNLFYCVYLEKFEIKRDQEVLGAFYQHLLAPVEAHLAGATEVLIIPHKELFEVPWPHSLTAKQGSI